MAVYLEEFNAFDPDEQTGDPTPVPTQRGGIGPIAVQQLDNGGTVVYSAALNSATRYVVLVATAAVRWSEQSGTTGAALNRYLPAAETSRPIRVTGGNTIAVVNA